MRSTVFPTTFSDLPQSGATRNAAATRRPVSLPIVTGLLGVVDGAAILLPGVTATQWVRLPVAAEWNFLAVVVLLGALIALNVQRFAGAYRVETVTAPGAGSGVTAMSWIIAVAVLGVPAALGRPEGDGFATWLGAWAGVALVALMAERQGAAMLVRRWRKADRLCRHVAIVGSGSLGERVLRQIESQRDGWVVATGLYDDRRTGATQGCGRRHVSGTVDDLVADIRRGGIDEVVIAVPSTDDRRAALAIHKLNGVPVDVRECVEALSFRDQPCRMVRLGGLNLIGIVDAPLRDWRWVCKAIEDRILAGLALALLSPVMLLIAAVIKCDSPGPALFRQKRHGLNNRLIEVLKFRTMYQHACDPNAESLTQRNDQRVTRIGAFLRRTMLDELPQLINVLRGDMSLVGPRPHAICAKAGGLLYRDAVPNYDARHRMKPGVTGWAQVNGWRGTTDTVEQIEKRVECDLDYVENWSVGLDLAIMLRTLLLPLKALRRA
ncbi:MAG TPA: undecaprenyl-phosphate glucose phosphotransferase [Stellaceae bacterium]|nr:undecaprenyl-phosphate glucose phosphotransferase [Stellaceae bacterium]